MKSFFRLLYFGLIAAIAVSCAKLTSEPVKGIIKSGDKIGEMTIERDESKHYYHLLDACEFDMTIIEPHSQEVECTVPELAVVGVGDFWGAEKTKIESNWEAMSWELYIDDYQITLDEFGWSDISYFDPGSGMDVTYRTGMSSSGISPLAGIRFVPHGHRKYPLTTVGIPTRPANMNI